MEKQTLKDTLQQKEHQLELEITVCCVKELSRILGVCANIRFAIIIFFIFAFVICAEI